MFCAKDIERASKVLNEHFANQIEDFSLNAGVSQTRQAADGALVDEAKFTRWRCANFDETREGSVMHHKLAHGAWVFVGDGQKALFLINEGDEKFPNLRRLAVEEHKDPPSLEQGSDAPGRAYSSVGEIRSADGETDWHELEKKRSLLRSRTGSIRWPCPARSTIL